MLPDHLSSVAATGGPLDGELLHPLHFGLHKSETNASDRHGLVKITLARPSAGVVAPLENRFRGEMRVLRLDFDCGCLVQVEACFKRLRPARYLVKRGNRNALPSKNQDMVFTVLASP